MKLCLPDDSEQFAELGDDGKPLCDHVWDLCKKYDLPSDEHGYSHVLTRTDGNEWEVLGTWDLLSEVPCDMQVSLKSYGDVILKCLGEVSTQPRETMWRLRGPRMGARSQTSI